MPKGVFVAPRLTALTLLVGVSARAELTAAPPVPAASAHAQSAQSAQLRSERTVNPLPVLKLPPPAALEPDWWTPSWHSLLLMTSMRAGEAVLWPDPFAETRGEVIARNYRAAYTQAPKWDARQDFFEWDGDPWPINALGHAVFGAELYYRPRACGHGFWPALGFATLGAALWDYGFEASGVRPSGLDLWYTPLAGAALGEVRYWGFRSSRHIHDPLLRGIVRGLLDPFGQIERALGAPC